MASSLVTNPAVLTSCACTSGTLFHAKLCELCPEGLTACTDSVCTKTSIEDVIDSTLLLLQLVKTCRCLSGCRGVHVIQHPAVSGSGVKFLGCNCGAALPLRRYVSSDVWIIPEPWWGALRVAFQNLIDAWIDLSSGSWLCG
jgi:hypothetical protein